MHEETPGSRSFTFITNHRADFEQMARDLAGFGVGVSIADYSASRIKVTVSYDVNGLALAKSRGAGRRSSVTIPENSPLDQACSVGDVLSFAKEHRAETVAAALGISRTTAYRRISVLRSAVQERRVPESMAYAEAMEVLQGGQGM